MGARQRSQRIWLCVGPKWLKFVSEDPFFFMLWPSIRTVYEKLKRHKTTPPSPTLYVCVTLGCVYSMVQEI